MNIIIIFPPKRQKEGEIKWYLLAQCGEDCDKGKGCCLARSLVSVGGRDTARPEMYYLWGEGLLPGPLLLLEALLLL